MNKEYTKQVLHLIYKILASLFFIYVSIIKFPDATVVVSIIAIIFIGFTVYRFFLRKKLTYDFTEEHSRFFKPDDKSDSGE